MQKLIYVPGEGSYGSDIVLVGEAPGETEEREGRPFIGRSGKLLRNVLSDLGVEEESLYITNVVKVRPEDNRTPTDEEIESWLPILDEEISLVKGLNRAAIVIAVGKTADYALNAAGIPHKHIWHPSYVLRTGKKAEWIKSIKDILRV